MYTIGRPKKQYDKAYIGQICNDYKTMSTKQVAEKYHISTSTVTRYIRMVRNGEVVLDEAAKS